MIKVDEHRQKVVSKLKPLCSNNRQWEAFSDYLDIMIADQQKKLEQSDTMISIHQAQGAVKILRQLKYLRDEALANG